MSQLTIFLLVVCLSLNVLSESAGEQSREARQLFYASPYPKDFFYAPEYDPYFQQRYAPTSQASQRLFFGLVPGLAGLLNPNRPIVCPTCKVCAANQVCVTPPAPAAFAALATGGCTTLANIGACTRASLAPSGTAQYTFAAATAGNALLTVLAEAPNSIVSVKCNLPAGITANTQNGALADSTFRDEAGFAQVLITGTSAAGATVTCTWQSR